MVGSWLRRRQWLAVAAAAACALFSVAGWGAGGGGGLRAAPAMWAARGGSGAGDASCRLSLAAGGSARGSRQLRYDSYDSCGCETAQTVVDPFYSSSGAFRPPAMEPRTSAGLPAQPASVLLLSHGRLQRLDLASKAVTVLLDKPRLRIRGVFMGGADPGAGPNAPPAAATYVLLTTPSLDRESRFMGVDGESGRVLYDVPAAGSKDAHDAVRVGDEIFVVSTGTGEIRVYDGAQPGRFPLLRAMPAADPQRGVGASHINTVGVGVGAVWVMRHNQGKRPAEVHVLDRHEERSLDLFPDVGRSSHGLAHWQEELVVLDSLNGRVLALHRLAKTTRVVWSCKQACFLKGLAVVGELALVGIAPPQRRMDRLRVNCSVVALSLATGREQWRLQPPPLPPADRGDLRDADGASSSLATMGLLNQIVPLPPSRAEQTLQPAALIPLKEKRETAANRVVSVASEAAVGYRMLGAVSISDARAVLQRDWTDAWSAAAMDSEHLFAPGLNARFPGVQHLRLLFSTGER
jgi:hypothetical protein